MSQTTRLKFKYIRENMVAESRFNKSLDVIDTFTTRIVIDKQNAPPPSPNEGDSYIVDDSPTGAWAGKGDSIATFTEGSWSFSLPTVEGQRVYVQNRNSKLIFDGAIWVARPLGQLRSLKLTAKNFVVDSGTPTLNNWSFTNFSVPYWSMPTAVDSKIVSLTSIPKHARIAGPSKFRINYGVDTTTSTQKILWRFNYWREADGDDISIGFSSGTINPNQSFTANNFYQATSALATNTFDEDELFIVAIERVGTDSLDTYTGEARFFSIEHERRESDDADSAW